MAINNIIRPLLCGLLIVLAGPAFNAQESSVPIGSASQGADSTSTVSHSTTLTEMPPKAPKVTCKDGQLTISSDNSTLGSVLAAVHTCIGVQFDIPEAAAGSRTFGDLGPGPERQVLESLLSGTDFNYVIGSSDTYPQRIEAILLMPRLSNGTNAPVTDRQLTPARRAWMQSRQNGRGPSASSDENQESVDGSSATPTTEDTGSVPVEQTQTDPTPPQVHDTPPPSTTEVPPVPSENSPAFVPAPATEASSGASPSSDQSKSTGDKIADMQQLFEERRKMTLEQNSTTHQP
jgi:hypothetical protein